MIKTEKIKLETELQKRFGGKLKKYYALKKFTTLDIGGPARYFLSALTENDLISAVRLAEKYKLKWYVVGEGSNIVPADQGFNGFIIRNQIEKFEAEDVLVRVGAGNNLLSTIDKLNSMGSAGFEKMAGIPGSVGGAVYGSAGAYGQEIKDRVVRVRFFDAGKDDFRVFTKKECGFGYRDSLFKRHKAWILTEITFKTQSGEPEELKKTSDEIVKLREKKYRPGLKCPGSFFKNIKLDELKSKSEMKKLFQNIDPDKIMYGKVPAGYLLEEVGAKGMEAGSIRVADHHANLIYNPNGGKASDIVRLAEKLKKLVETRFGVRIEEEIQYLGFE